MIPNSSTTFINEDEHLRSVFGSENIQSPITNPIFEQGSHIVNGVYVQVKPYEANLYALDEIAREFAAWETASDEDFLKFEKENL